MQPILCTVGSIFAGDWVGLPNVIQESTSDHPPDELLETDADRARRLEARVRELESAQSQLEAYAGDLQWTYGELRRHLQHLTVLHEISTRLSSARQPGDVLSNLLDSLGQLVEFDSVAVHLVDTDIALETGAHPEAPPGDPVPRLFASRPEPLDQGTLVGTPAPPEGVASQAFESGEIVAGQCGAMLQTAFPLRSAGRTLGVLELRRLSPITEHETSLLNLLLAHAAVALQNAYLYEQAERQAITDPLTGLSNRRNFDELLKLEVERARRMGYSLGFMMMDLDRFRRVNARYLHSGGDSALRRVADILRERLRRTDVIGRLGGEEFGALLPGASIDDVAAVAEKIRSAVEELPPLDETLTPAAVRVTVSIGGTSLPGAEVDVQGLQQRADTALYRAKRRGRNQVQLWREKEVDRTRTRRSRGTLENGPRPDAGD